MINEKLEQKQEDIQIIYLNFQLFTPIMEFEYLIINDKFKFQYKLTELERKIYLTKKSYYDERLDTLTQYVLIAKSFYGDKLSQKGNFVVQGIVSLFHKQDLNATSFYIHIKNKRGNTEPIGQFTLRDKIIKSENNEINHSFQSGFEYPWYILSNQILQREIIPLLIQFYSRNKDNLDKEKITFKDLIYSLTYFCIA